MSTLSKMTRVLRLSLSMLGSPQTVLVRLRHEPLWPPLAILAQWRLAATHLGPIEFVTHLLPELPRQDALRVMEQIKSRTALYTRLAECERESAAGPPGTFFSGTSLAEAEVLYSIVRLLSPSRVVETGVAAGVSSTFILQALADNEGGELHSIDLPLEGAVGDGHTYWRPPGKELGWMVPESLRSRWHLVLGRSEDTLVPLLERLGNIDIFLHDSLHTFRNMHFEYRSAWPVIRKGGCLLSHDVSHPYVSLCRELGAAPVRCHKLGGIRKHPQQEP